MKSKVLTILAVCTMSVSMVVPAMAETRTVVKEGEKIESEIEDFTCYCPVLVKTIYEKPTIIESLKDNKGDTTILNSDDFITKYLTKEHVLIKDIKEITPYEEQVIKVIEPLAVINY